MCIMIDKKKDDSSHKWNFDIDGYLLSFAF